MAAIQPAGQQFFCRLFVGGSEIISKNILSITIREWAFEILPRIEISIEDEGLLFEKAPLEDNDEIIVKLAKNEDVEDAFEASFTLADYAIEIVNDNRVSIVNMSGYLRVKDIFTLKNRSFARQTSREVLQFIAGESELTFRNPQNISSNDSMTWYQISLSNYNFIKHMLKRASVADDALLFYGNTDGEFVYTSLYREMNKRDSVIARHNIDKATRNSLSDEDASSMWYNAYNIVNLSSYYNKKTGYGINYNYYDFEREVSEQTNGREKLTELFFKDQELVGKPVASVTYSSYDDRNIHGDYFASAARNLALINDFFGGISLVISINSLYPVKLLDKVDLILPSMVAEEEMNEAHSGEFLVGGIVHHIARNGVYSKFVSLNRNGLNKSPYLKNYRSAE